MLANMVIPSHSLLELHGLIYVFTPKILAGSYADRIPSGKLT